MEKLYSPPTKNTRNFNIFFSIFFFTVDSHPGCGASGSTLKWMESVARSAVSEEDGDQDDDDPAAVIQDEDPEDEAAPEALPFVSDSENPEYKYTAEANYPGRRYKRAMENPNKKKSCSLYIQTDPLFWRHIRETVSTDIQRLV